MHLIGAGVFWSSLYFWAARVCWSLICPFTWTCSLCHAHIDCSLLFTAVQARDSRFKKLRHLNKYVYDLLKTVSTCGWWKGYPYLLFACCGLAFSLQPQQLHSNHPLLKYSRYPACFGLTLVYIKGTLMLSSICVAAGGYVGFTERKSLW